MNSEWLSSSGGEVYVGLLFMDAVSMPSMCTVCGEYYKCLKLDGFGPLSSQDSDSSMKSGMSQMSHGCVSAVCSRKSVTQSIFWWMSIMSCISGGWGVGCMPPIVAGVSAVVSSVV